MTILTKRKKLRGRCRAWRNFGMKNKRVVCGKLARHKGYHERTVGSVTYVWEWDEGGYTGGVVEK